MKDEQIVHLNTAWGRDREQRDQTEPARVNFRWPDANIAVGHFFYFIKPHPFLLLLLLFLNHILFYFYYIYY